MVVVRRRNRAAQGEQRHRALLRRLAGRGERLPLERVLVRLVEQHREPGPQRVGQAMRTELVGPRGHLLGLALPALDRGERRGQRIGRRLAVAALAPLVEEHRRGGECHRHGGGLDGQRRMARNTRARDRRSRIRRRRRPPTGSSDRARAPASCASATSVDGDGSAYRNSTAAALIFRRLPVAASTCNDESLSARIVPAFSWPSSSKKTCMRLLWPRAQVIDFDHGRTPADVGVSGREMGTDAEITRRAARPFYRRTNPWRRSSRHI